MTAIMDNLTNRGNFKSDKGDFVMKFKNSFIDSAEAYLLDCVFDGLAHSYDVISQKYVKPYPEVTGYIIKYFCDTKEALPENIVQAADNLVLLQDEKSGGFASFSDKNTLYAFDTSQILIGMAAIYEKTGSEIYKKAAMEGGEFLLMMQQGNGAIVPTYDRKLSEKVVSHSTYSIWNGPWSGLMCKLTEGFEALYSLTKEQKYLDAKNRTADFYENADYIECTHPLGYWLEGLYEADRKDKVDEILRKKVIPRIRSNGYIPYKEDLEYAYVSGVMQLGIILYKMGYAEEAGRIREYGRTVQKEHESGGLLQYADENGKLDHHIHTEINSWGTKYFCQLEQLLEGDVL